MKTKVIPRGIRNNNPLNIRVGNVWLGEVKNPTDPHFEQFNSMEYGLRAGFVLLRRYIRHYNRLTIEDIITSWAPSNENNTKAYIDTVVKVSGIPSNRILHYSDKDTMCKLVDAMCFVENGKHVSMEKITKGYDLA